MKIITDNAVYVQKNDIAFFNRTDLLIPASIFMKVFGNGVVIIDDSNRYEFVEFNTPEEIKFFKMIDWIIDYDEVKDLSEEEIIALAQNIADEKNNIAQMFNSMTLDERDKNIDMVSQCKLLDFKMYSLRDFLWFKQGHIKMELPEGTSLPVEFAPKNRIRNLIKTIFNKN